MGARRCVAPGASLIPVVLVLSVGCEGAPTKLSGPVVQLPPAPAGPEAGSYYDERVKMAKVVPGFAGIYVDSDQVDVILLVDPAQAEAARREMSKRFGVDARTVRITSAKYDFIQLATWKAAMRDVFAVPGVVSLGIDERRNMVTVGVTASGSVQVIRAFGERAGLPVDALAIEPGEVYQKLRETVRVTLPWPFGSTDANSR